MHENWSLIKEKAKDHVLRSQQIRNVNHKIYQVKKQDHVGKHEAKCEASGEPGGNIVDYRIPDISLSTVQEQD